MQHGWDKGPIEAVLLARVPLIGADRDTSQFAVALIEQLLIQGVVQKWCCSSLSATPSRGERPGCNGRAACGASALWLTLVAKTLARQGKVRSQRS